MQWLGYGSDAISIRKRCPGRQYNPGGQHSKNIVIEALRMKGPNLSKLGALIDEAKNLLKQIEYTKWLTFWQKTWLEDGPFFFLENANNTFELSHERHFS